MSSQDLPPGPESSQPLRYRTRPKPAKQQYLVYFSLLLLGFLIALAGGAAGFMYGDSYGRKHAQYNNPILREHYSGQCYAYWETQFQKTVRVALSRPQNTAEQSLRLDEIRGLLVDMQQNLIDLAAQKEPKGKKKKATDPGVTIGSSLPSPLVP